MKKIVVENYGVKTECWLEVSKYANNGNLAIEMYCDEGPFATITVNTSKKLEPDLAAVKTYSENEFVPEMLRKYKLARPTIINAEGFPVWRFDLFKIAQYKYQEPKKNRYEKLEEALAEAVYQTDCAVLHEPDTGTCNFDHLLISLPRYQRKRVIEIVKSVTGSDCYAEGGGLFSINKTYGQGMRNTKAQEKMHDVLQDMGYDVYVKYMMD